MERRNSAPTSKPKRQSNPEEQPPSEGSNLESREYIERSRASSSRDITEIPQRELPKGTKRKFGHSGGDGSYPNTFGNVFNNGNSLANRTDADDAEDGGEWEIVSIPYTRLPPELSTIWEKSKSSVNEANLGFNSSRSTPANFITVPSSNTENRGTNNPTLNQQIKTGGNGIGYDNLASMIETCSIFPTFQEVSGLQSLDADEVQTSTISTPNNEVLDHVFVRGPFPDAESSENQEADMQVDIPQEDSPTVQSDADSRTQPMLRRKVLRAKKTKSETSVKGLYSDIPLQSFVTHQFTERHPNLNLTPKAARQMEGFLSEMVGRISEEAKNLVILSTKTRVDERVLKYAIKLTLERMKKEGEVAAGKSNAWLF